MAFRSPSPDEVRLLRFLGNAAALPRDWLGDVAVEDMSDGGMGSLRLRAGPEETSKRVFGGVLSACQFQDTDDIDVIATLYADQDGLPFELEMWKVDFNKIAHELEDLEEHEMPKPKADGQ